MNTKVVTGLLVLTVAGAAVAQGQAQPGLHPFSERRPAPILIPQAPQIVTLIVPKGTPLQVVIDTETRIQKVGQSIHGHIAMPVYAFDHLVIPVGSEVKGTITKIDSVSNRRRVLEALNADFTPPRTIAVEFNELVLPNQVHLPLQTNATPGSGQVIQFTSAPQKKSKKDQLKNVASDKVNQTKQQARQEWDKAMKQVQTPGRMHRLRRYLVAQLPAHPQYLDPGVLYFAELQAPLQFGQEPLTGQMASTIGSAPPIGSIVHARLVTPLSSATTKKGDAVTAELTQPLFDGANLILPQGSQLKGDVLQVRPARHLAKNGQLRIAFHELVPPDGIERKIQATLEGVQTAKNGNVKLDAEGGAEATSSKSRYLETAIALSLAAVAGRGDSDALGGNAAGNTGNRVAGGAGGFKLVGIVLGLTVRSHALGAVMGAYGAGTSIYQHFIARGHEVVFPQNTAMEVGIAGRAPAPSSK